MSQEAADDDWEDDATWVWTCDVCDVWAEYLKAMDAGYGLEQDPLLVRAVNGILPAVAGGIAVAGMLVGWAIESRPSPRLLVAVAGRWLRARDPRPAPPCSVHGWTHCPVCD